MAPEQERWAVASKLLETRADDIGTLITGRIKSLAEKGDSDGVRFWIDISHKVMQLAGPDEGGWTQ